MFDQDTICAVSTAAGVGSIAIIRVSGKDAIGIAGRLFDSKGNVKLAHVSSHTIHFGWICDPESGERIDEVLVSVMRRPRTYTREDVIEINCHGGIVPLKRTLKILQREGARLAAPGEFTKRAFLNGRIDMTQAEAVMDVISARTEKSHKAAKEQLEGGLSKATAEIREQVIGLLAGVEATVDFPEEDIETPSGVRIEKEIGEIQKRMSQLISRAAYGRLLREGIAVAIVGRPNVGKSSLMNALLMRERAIVTDIPGTTRDVIEEGLNIDGMPVRIIDTAGIRDTHDMVEREGVKRSLLALESADVVLTVFDGSEPLHDADRFVIEAVGCRKAVIAVINKDDCKRKLESLPALQKHVIVSCKDGRGLEILKREIVAAVTQEAFVRSDHAWVINERHREALEQAAESMERARRSVQDRLSPELIAVDLRDALDQVGTIIGTTYTEDILERIFRDFCIGK
ncbi:MAG: tRNA uridine-5-carboxymethylaminomethyl(34) synthesis GTPase MnmE [Nitrospiraceae bacterium]|nr:tRNA uridine-5-carboxymethylaminomethyl(34) synthesis GTPase MnmE [Nitrospiraceae bacterium]